MTAADVASWLTGLFALVGAGIALGAGLVAAAAFIRFAWRLCVAASGDLIAWSDLREAVNEWRDAHPDKAARYRDGSGPWRSW